MATASFFQNMVPFLEGTDLAINLKSKDGLITVSVLPRPNATATNKIKGSLAPLIITGSAEELDNGFFDAVSQPLADTAGLSVQLEEFKKSLQKTKEDSEKDIKNAQVKNSSSSSPSSSKKKKAKANAATTTNKQSKPQPKKAVVPSEPTAPIEAETKTSDESAGATASAPAPVVVAQQTEMFPVATGADNA